MSKFSREVNEKLLEFVVKVKKESYEKGRTDGYAAGLEEGKKIGAEESREEVMEEAGNHAVLRLQEIFNEITEIEGESRED